MSSFERDPPRRGGKVKRKIFFLECDDDHDPHLNNSDRRLRRLSGCREDALATLVKENNLEHRRRSGGVKEIHPRSTLDSHIEDAQEYHPSRSSLDSHIEDGLIKGDAQDLRLNIGRSSSSTRDALATLVKESDLEYLRQCGGVEEIARALDSHIEGGIKGDARDLRFRRTMFGSNTYSALHLLPAFLMETLKDTPFLILLFAAILSLVMGIERDGWKDGWYDGAAIFLLLLVVAVVTLLKKFRHPKLNMIEKQYHGKILVNVIRSGQRKQISVLDVVVGDAVRLGIGDRVPADGLFIKGDTLELDLYPDIASEIKEMVSIGMENPFLYAHSMVVGGEAHMLVTSVGLDTLRYEILGSEYRGSNEHKKPLLDKLEKLSSSIENIGSAITLLLLVVLSLRCFITPINTDDDDMDPDPGFYGGKTKMGETFEVARKLLMKQNLLMNKLLCIFSIFLALPQNMAVAMGLFLYYWRNRMMAIGVKARHLSSIGTMARVSTIVIVIDKDIIHFPAKQMRRAVMTCKNAGIDIKIVTKDGILTATKLALEWGIMRPDMGLNGAVITGSRLLEQSATERVKMLGKVCVMASSSTFDELLLVNCLKRNGHVVAVIGGGTSHKPILKEANLRVSMRSSDSKEVDERSNIIVFDNNPISLLEAFGWGQSVCSNIKKFVQLQVTLSILWLTINFVEAVSLVEVPVSAMQLLWVDLFVGTIGAVALADKAPTVKVAMDPAVGRWEPLITNIMWRNILAQALFQIVVMLTLQLKGEAILGVEEDVKKALAFNTFFLCQVFNVFNARELEEKNVFKGIEQNRLFWWLMGSAVVMQEVMMQFGPSFLVTKRLNWVQCAACIGLAAVSLPIGCIAKSIPVPEGPYIGLLGLLSRGAKRIPVLSMDHYMVRKFRCGWINLRSHAGYLPVTNKFA